MQKRLIDFDGPLKIKLEVTLTETEIINALNEEARIKVFGYLITHPGSRIRDIANGLSLTQGKTRTALGNLVNAYLVSCERPSRYNPRYNLYSVNPTLLKNGDFRKIIIQKFGGQLDSG